MKLGTADGLLNLCWYLLSVKGAPPFVFAEKNVQNHQKQNDIR